MSRNNESGRERLQFDDPSVQNFYDALFALGRPGMRPRFDVTNWNDLKKLMRVDDTAQWQAIFTEPETDNEEEKKAAMKEQFQNYISQHMKENSDPVLSIVDKADRTVQNITVDYLTGGKRYEMSVQNGMYKAGDPGLQEPPAPLPVPTRPGLWARFWNTISRGALYKEPIENYNREMARYNRDMVKWNEENTKVQNHNRTATEKYNVKLERQQQQEYAAEATWGEFWKTEDQRLSVSSKVMEQSNWLRKEQESTDDIHRMQNRSKMVYGFKYEPKEFEAEDDQFKQWRQEFPDLPEVDLNQEQEDVYGVICRMSLITPEVGGIRFQEQGDIGDDVKMAGMYVFATDDVHYCRNGLSRLNADVVKDAHKMTREAFLDWQKGDVTKMANIIKKTVTILATGNLRSNLGLNGRTVDLLREMDTLNKFLKNNRDLSQAVGLTEEQQKLLDANSAIVEAHNKANLAREKLLSFEVKDPEESRKLALDILTEETISAMLGKSNLTNAEQLQENSIRLMEQYEQEYAQAQRDAQGKPNFRELDEAAQVRYNQQVNEGINHASDVFLRYNPPIQEVIDLSKPGALKELRSKLSKSPLMKNMDKAVAEGKSYSGEVLKYLSVKGAPYKPEQGQQLLEQMESEPEMSHEMPQLGVSKGMQKAMELAEEENKRSLSMTSHDLSKKMKGMDKQ